MTAPISLVGRGRELADLLGQFDQARSGHARSVAILGPPGAGASALLGTFREDLGRRGLAHRWVSTRGRAGDSSYAALAGLVGATGHLRAGRAAGLEDLVAGLAPVPPEARPSVVGDRLARMLDPAEGDPLVLVVHRLDAMDPLALDCLGTTVRALARTRTLVVVTSHAPRDWPADRVLRLGPLCDRDAATLARTLAPDDPARAGALIDLSARLPGHMAELNRWPDPRVPASDRLEQLARGAAAVTYVAGLTEGFVPLAELATLAGAAPSAVDLLVEHGVLRRVDRDDGSPDGDRRERSATSTAPTWEVPDAWWQAAAGATMPDQLRALARRAADALERGGAPERARARALELAGDPRAAAAWRQAADEAAPDADARADHLLRAWRWALGGTPEGRFPTGADSELARACGDALLAVGRTEDALHVLADGLRLTPRRDRIGRVRLLSCQHRALLQAGDHREAGRVLAEAIALLPDGPVSAASELARSEALTLRSMDEVITDPRAAGVTAQKACDSAERSGDLATRAAALGSLALARGLAGDPAAALFEEALALADESTDRALEARIAANRIFVLWRGGDLPAMEAAVASELARLERTGLVAAAGGQLLVARAVALHGLGRWDALGEHLERTLADPERLGAQVELLMRLVALELAADLGRIAEARTGLASLSGHPAFADPEIAYEIMAARLRLALLAGDLPRSAAVDLACESMEQAGHVPGDPYAAALLRVGALRLLASAHDQLGGPVDLAGMPGEPFDADEQATSGAAAGPAELHALLLEEAAWRTGQGWAPAILAWDGLPMPYRRAWAQVWSAHAAVRAGRADEALALADQASRTAQSLGALPLLAAVQRLGRRLGRRGLRTEGTLTPRERDVIGMVARGLTNREVARALGMSDRTVAVHLTRIFAKLGAGTRGEAVNAARHLGQLEP